MHFSDFEELWAVDFEFSSPPGEVPTPVCLVGRELKSDRLVRVWQDDLARRDAPPYRTDPKVLFIAYYASAELGCHLALDWSLPTYVLDLFVEFRNLTNGKPTPCGRGLLGALTYYGLDGMAALEKHEMREVAMKGPPWSAAEVGDLLDYCQADVDSLARLFRRMRPLLSLPHAVFRGRYMKAVARMEHVGTPIDEGSLQTLRRAWPDIKGAIIEEVDQSYGVYEGRTFKMDRWERWLAQKHIPWPRLASGRLALDDNTFREMARVYPQVAPVRELRYTISQMRLHDLSVGADGRNRCLLSAFGAKTGRNTPSNTKHIFGPSVWLRGLIRPPSGWGIAYIDWSQQEFGIAAGLSGDEAMIRAYTSEDPYLEFGRQAGAIPPEGTRETHGNLREMFKACALAVQYGMGEDSLARKINQPTHAARELLHKHRETYSRFWTWSDAAVDSAMLRGSLRSVFGWSIWTAPDTNARTLRNFPMQANGAEMLRLACSKASEQGVRVCAPIHDALLIEAPLDRLSRDIEVTQNAMSDASNAVLPGLRLRSDVAAYRWPERYVDERGRGMWNTVFRLLGRPRAEQ